MRLKHRTLLASTLTQILIAVLSTACVSAAAQASAQEHTPLSIPITAAESNPAAVLMTYPEWTRRIVCESNVFYNQNPLHGKTVRFQTPIDINPNGIILVLDAIKNYEAMTSGAVTFRIVDSDPAVGITIVEGDALTRDGEPGCGHVTCARDPRSGFTLKVSDNGVINSLLYVHLGSSHCNYTLEGFQSQSIAEHELGHALGLGKHFAGFTGIEGITLELLVTVSALYRLPPGTDLSKICTGN